MRRRVRAFLSRLKFALGMNPRAEKRRDGRGIIPAPFKALVLIQADFEMAWGWRWTKEFAGQIQGALDMARRERANIPKILDLCDQYNIPITWATVGHLFLERCHRESGKAHPEITRPGHFENEFWKFSGDDWFEHDPCADAGAAPEWYAPDLVRMILSRPVRHEIACHTFSHVDCSDGVCPSELLGAEITASRKAVAPFGIDFKSFVHPGHFIGNLETLKKTGFTSFRTYANVLGFPVDYGDGLWELKSTMEFILRPGLSTPYQLYRYKTTIDRAIKNRALCLFWFHPSLPESFLEEIMPSLFAFLDQRRSEVLISTTGSYIDRLNDSVMRHK